MVDLSVHYEDRLVATISADAQATRLAYADAWTSSAESFPVSLAMPIRPEPYEGEQVLPWLMNLLPEGEPLRAMTRALGAAPEDALGLIAQTGNDLAGALSIAQQQPRGKPGYRTIPDADALERIIEELPARPFLVGEDGVSMSLAGAQEKLPVAVIDGQIAVPIKGAPSTHILKPDNPRLPGSVQNEALCMLLAGRIGLNVAPVTTGVAGEHSYLLVERYDRAPMLPSKAMGYASSPIFRDPVPAKRGACRGAGRFSSSGGTGMGCLSSTSASAPQDKAVR